MDVARARAVNARKDRPEAEPARIVRIGFPVELEVPVPPRGARIIRMHIDPALIHLPDLDAG